MDSNTKKCNICKLYLDLSLFKANKRGDKLKACKECNQKRLESRVNNTCIHNKRKSKCEICAKETYEDTINAFRPGGSNKSQENNNSEKIVDLLTSINEKLQFLCVHVQQTTKIPKTNFVENLRKMVENQERNDEEENTE